MRHAPRSLVHGDELHRSASGSRFDLQTEGGWRTGRMVERYTKSRPFEERRRGPLPFTAFREATRGKRPKGSSHHNREAACPKCAQREQAITMRSCSPEG